MAMDFWEAQRRARKITALYVTIFILMAVAVAICVEFAFQAYLSHQAEIEMLQASNNSSNYSIPIIGPMFLIITLGVAWGQYLTFRSGGGGHVARSVGAIKVKRSTSDFKQQQLLNIVDEMAIAASVPVPKVYLMPVKQINAFAAGTSLDNAALAVTQGTLDALTRDELQGVVAHEFGHIVNADMSINLRLAAMVMGFFFVLYIGLRILQFSAMGRSRKGGNPVALVAILMLVAGAFTWLFGSILKASVSRQREYLADASAVQFTRNPEGISNALRKIAKETEKDMPRAGMAFSHMYLDSHRSLESIFATHPPLAKRIARLEGSKVK